MGKKQEEMKNETIFTRATCSRKPEHATQRKYRGNLWEMSLVQYLGKGGDDGKFGPSGKGHASAPNAKLRHMIMHPTGATDRFGE